MANPIAASAAATVKINSVNICPLKSLINIEKEQGLCLLQVKLVQYSLK